MAHRPGRNGYAWANTQRRTLKGATTCHLCGYELDFDAPPRTRWSPSVDHIVPLSLLRGYDRMTQERMAVAPSNLRPAHYGCNARRGNGPPKPVRRASQQW